MKTNEFREKSMEVLANLAKEYESAPIGKKGEVFESIKKREGLEFSSSSFTSILKEKGLLSTRAKSSSGPSDDGLKITIPAGIPFRAYTIKMPEAVWNALNGVAENCVGIKKMYVTTEIILRGLSQLGVDPFNPKT